MQIDQPHTQEMNQRTGEAGSIGDCPCVGDGGCVCAQSSPRRFVSPFKVTLALGLAALVGSFSLLKPEPQGVLAGDTAPATRIAPEELRHIVLGQTGAQDASEPGIARADEWRLMGTLESDGLLIRIETRENAFGEPILAYTAIDRTGVELASRVTIEDLRSEFPRLDWDSLTAAGSGRLMLADDNGQP